MLASAALSQRSPAANVATEKARTAVALLDATCRTAFAALALAAVALGTRRARVVAAKAALHNESAIIARA